VFLLAVPDISASVSLMYLTGFNIPKHREGCCCVMSLATAYQKEEEKNDHGCAIHYSHTYELSSS
jgi:hypothetical protein